MMCQRQHSHFTRSRRRLSPAPTFSLSSCLFPSLLCLSLVSLPLVALFFSILFILSSLSLLSLPPFLPSPFLSPTLTPCVSSSFLSPLPCISHLLHLSLSYPSRSIISFSLLPLSSLLFLSSLSLILCRPYSLFIYSSLLFCLPHSLLFSSLSSLHSF